MAASSHNPLVHLNGILPYLPHQGETTFLPRTGETVPVLAGQGGFGSGSRINCP